MDRIVSMSRIDDESDAAKEDPLLSEELMSISLLADPMEPSETPVEAESVLLRASKDKKESTEEQRLRPVSVPESTSSSNSSQLSSHSRTCRRSTNALSNLPTSNPRPTASDGTIPEQAECMVIGAVGLMNGGSSAPGDLAEKGGFLSVDYWSSPASFD
ncbi:unnamed protein product [Tilletia controversa]|nr:unnamed protein product [Tilletia controversa]